MKRSKPPTFLTILLSVIILILAYHTTAARGFREQLDRLEAKFTAQLKKTAAAEKQLGVLFLTTEAAAICARLHETPDTKDILNKRLDQYQLSMRSATSFDEKILRSSAGLYNWILFVASNRCAGRAYMRIIEDADKQANAIARNDSIPNLMKGALLLSQAYKVSTVLCMHVDSLGRRKTELEKLIQGFDEAAGRARTAIDGIELSGEYMARTLHFFSVGLFPRLRREMDIRLQQISIPALSAETRLINNYSALFQIVVLLSRRLDLG